jgi:DNA-binding MarR family transcriptional regulator
MYEWELPDSVFNAWVRLRQAWEAMERLLSTELDIYHTTLYQIDILMILSVSRAPLTQSEIASFRFREKHTTSELITRMEKAGYVKKIRGKKDQRSIKIRMQPKGEELLKEAVGSGFAYARRVMKAALSEEEIKQLGRLLKKLRDGALRELALATEPLPDTLDARRMLSGWE